MNNGIHIFVASINFQRLDNLSNQLLEEAGVDNSENTLNSLRQRLGFTTEQIAIIEKCNAVSIVITCFGEYETSFIKGRLLAAWDDIVKLGLTNAYKYIKFYDDTEALKYLAECALGLHSVIPGDSQVLAQVCGALQDSDSCQQKGFRLFPSIVTFIKKLAVEAKTESNLHDGNVSLERVAAEFIKGNSDPSSKILVLGAGKTGALMVKILSSEYRLNVSIANRSEAKRDALILKYPKLTSGNYDDMEKYTHLIIALSNNKDTQTYIAKILGKIDKDVIITDLSSPSITGVIGTIANKILAIKEMSEISNKRIDARKTDIDKVRALIQRQLPGYSDAVNKIVAKHQANERKKIVPVKLDDNALRLLKVRNACNVAIRKLYEEKGFLEVTTPYIVGVSSDPPRVDNGGVFTIDWPNGGTAFLRQSNQLYKQMIVASGIDKMFEIGPFWRAEESTTYRHLLESIGLDVEFSSAKSIADVYGLAYTTILAVEEGMRAVAGLNKSVLMLPALSKVPVLAYAECIALLRSKGHNIKYGQDLGLIGESKLGQIMKKERRSDALIIINYPDTIKKFYTMRRENGETETFDIIIDGWELVSGAMRNTNREQIEKSMLLSGVNINDYSFYLSVVSGAITHGGFCLGLDRMIAKTLDIEVVAGASPFPRTAETLVP